MHIAHQKGWSGPHYVPKSKYEAILSIMAAPRPAEDVPHCPNMLPVAGKLSGWPLAPQGAMLWAGEGGFGATMMDEPGDLEERGFDAPRRQRPPAPAIRRRCRRYRWVRTCVSGHRRPSWCRCWGRPRCHFHGGEVEASVGVM